MTRGYGHIRNPPDPRDWPAERLLGAPRIGSVPDSVDYSGHIDRVRDQGATNSCVGHAIAEALYLQGQLTGNPIPFPSPFAIYSLALAYASPAPATLLDFGCFPRDALSAIGDGDTQRGQWGVVAESEWVAQDAVVNGEVARLPIDVLEKGSCAVVSGFYSVATVSIADGLKWALAQKTIPMFAMPVDQPYEDMRGGIYPGLQGPVKGNHMQAVVGYGPGYFLVLGSWGPDFGNGGLVQIAETFFDSGQVMDPTVFTSAPAGVR